MNAFLEVLFTYYMMVIVDNRSTSMQYDVQFTARTSSLF